MDGALPTLADLTTGVAHAWVARLDIAASERDDYRQMLSAGEIQRAEQFRFAADRHRFVAAHGILRVVLGRYLGLPPRQLRILSTANRKPVLLAMRGPGLHFNLAHSGECALIALSSSHPVGADLEWVRPMPDALQIAARFFSPAEAEALAAAPPGERTRLFFRAWTRKEAFVKAIGEGLAFPLDRVTVALDEPARLISIAGDSQAAAGWTLHHLAVGSELLAPRARSQEPVCEIPQGSPLPVKNARCDRQCERAGDPQPANVEPAAAAQPPIGWRAQPLESEPDYIGAVAIQRSAHRLVLHHYAR